MLFAVTERINMTERRLLVIGLLLFVLGVVVVSLGAFGVLGEGGVWEVWFFLTCGVVSIILVAIATRTIMKKRRDS